MSDTLHIIFDSLNNGHSNTLHFSNSNSTSTGFKWLDYLKPTIELLIALVGAFVLVWKYLTQRQKEFAERIIENKRNAYSEFLRDFTRSVVNIMHDIEPNPILDDKERMQARNQLLLYANDKVIKAYHEWIKFSDNEEREKDINEEVRFFPPECPKKHSQ